MDWVQIIQTLGFPIACVLACGFFIYKLVNRDKDEAKQREDKYNEINMKYSEAMGKIADTIKDSNMVNKELSETNRMLVEKIEDKLTGIDNNITKMLDKLDK